MRDSSTVWVNSLGAASTAVSSTSPSGRVRFSIAFCCGDRLVASRSRIWSQTVARSSVASAMPFFLPMRSTPGRSRYLRRARSIPFGCVQMRQRIVDALPHWVHTGVHRLCTAGGTTCRAPHRVVHRSAFLQVSARFRRENG